MSSAPDQSPQGVIHDEADEDVTSGRHLRTDYDRRNNHRHKDRAGEDKAGTSVAPAPATTSSSGSSGCPVTTSWPTGRAP